MPELPEVEVVKRSLTNKTQNLIIKAVKINDGRLRYKINRNKIKKIIGLKFKKISRRSKYLLFFFDKDIVMLVHLGMTGKFFFVNSERRKYKTSFYYDLNEEKDKKHDRIIFDLSNDNYSPIIIGKNNAKVIVSTSSDFFSNENYGLYSNLEFGIKLFRFLNYEINKIFIAEKTRDDLSLLIVNVHYSFLLHCVGKDTRRLRRSSEPDKIFSRCSRRT